MPWIHTCMCVFKVTLFCFEHNGRSVKAISMSRLQTAKNPSLTQTVAHTYCWKISKDDVTALKMVNT